MSKAARRDRRKARKIATLQEQNRHNNLALEHIEPSKKYFDMKDIRIQLTSLLDRGATSLFFCLVVGGVALSGQFSLTITRVCLLLAWFIVVFLVGNKRPEIKYSSIFLSGCLLFVLGYIFVPGQVASDVGLLQPDRAHTIFQNNHVDRKIEIGDSGTIIVYGGPEGGNLFLFAKDYELKVEAVDGVVKVSTAVRDENGKNVAEIIRNEWKVSPPPNTWDRNYNNNSLEVKDGRGDIVLQVSVLSDRVRVQGKWRTGKYSGISFVKSPAGDGALMDTLGPGKGEFSTNIKPMFKYPSLLHLGELAGE
jgi:hypothetical protein